MQTNNSLQLWQVHVYRRGDFSGMSEWVALRPTRKRNQPTMKPYLYTEDEARAKIKELEGQGRNPKNLRMVEA
jgi:hypothetical protein